MSRLSPREFSPCSDLPSELQATFSLNANPELPTAQEICPIVHSEKAYIIAFFFLFYPFEIPFVFMSLGG